jgi:hypothetical protein
MLFNSRVEIRHQGKWGTVCGNSFSVADARVTCRAMGFGGGTIKYKFGREFYKESVSPMPIWINNAQCQVSACREVCGVNGAARPMACRADTEECWQGDEVMLQHCKGVHAMEVAQQWPVKACEDHDTDVGVCCIH